VPGLTLMSVDPSHLLVTQGRNLIDFCSAPRRQKLPAAAFKECCCEFKLLYRKILQPHLALAHPMCIGPKCNLQREMGSSRQQQMAEPPVVAHSGISGICKSGIGAAENILLQGFAIQRAHRVAR